MQKHVYNVESYRGGVEAIVDVYEVKHGVYRYSVYGKCEKLSDARERCAKTVEDAEEIAHNMAESLLTRVTGVTEEQYINSAK